MRVLLVSPLPRWFLLLCKLLAGVSVALIQVYVFLLIAWFWEIYPPVIGYFLALPALLLAGLMLGAFGLLLSSFIKQLENFAGVDEFCDFPDVFRVVCTLPLVENTRCQFAALTGSANSTRLLTQSS